MFFQLPKETPQLNIGKRCGTTDYIDFITLNEVSSSIMYGKDCFQRSFIVIKFKVENYDKPIMQTFFQRYTEGNLWVGCGHATSLLIETDGGLTEIQKNFIQNIIDKQEIKLEEIHRPYPNLIGNKVKLY